MKFVFLILIILGLSIQLKAQNVVTVEAETKLHSKRKVLRIPDIHGYKTMKCDLHMHTIFSDGDVWPTVRVQEAYSEGLDAIAITDHIENEPRKEFVDGNGNSAYEIALPEAEKLNILLIKGGEISRKMPPGHINALFLDDVSKLDTENYMDAIKEASKQGAFISWNHPAWPTNRENKMHGWWDVHEKMYKNGWLHGIEVFNMEESFPIAMDWCVDKNLAFLSNSDVHKVSTYDFNYEKYMRPMTLVFAKEASMEGVKEALFAKRTVAYFADQLAGPEYLLKELFNKSLVVKKPFRVEENQASFQLVNPTDYSIVLHNAYPAANAPKEIKIHPGSSVIVKCTLEEGKADLPYKVVNFHTATDEILNIVLKVHK